MFTPRGPQSATTQSASPGILFGYWPARKGGALPVEGMEPRGPAPKLPPHNPGRALQQDQDSSLGAGVYDFSIRPLMVSPTLAQQPHVRPAKKKNGRA